MSGKNFALIGAAGYIAPRHMEAIKATGNNLVAALDKNDSVGILDKYFPDADFFTEFERFDRHLEKLKRKGTKVDYISICSPNYLHDAHIRFALRYGADAICEKPLVLNPWNVDALAEIEKETGRKIHPILQLRLHPAIQELKKKVEQGPKDKVYDVELTYITPRGKWYYSSWKGDESKSGGIGTNIGIHFFDVLIWIFGEVKNVTLNLRTHDRVGGELKLGKANVKWFLSINQITMKTFSRENLSVYRKLLVNKEEFEFSSGTENLHSANYIKILNNEWLNINDCKPSIELSKLLREIGPLQSTTLFPPSFYQDAKHPFQDMDS
jgi:UDP-N-acetyl-2-amino-2-deoxyglucuronate dehydrogenase